MAKAPQNYWTEDPKEDEQKIAKDAADSRIQERIDQYMSDLDKSSITASDRSQIKNLARLDIAIEELTNKLSGIADASDKTAKTLSDNLTRLMAQHRQISSLLGIDRKSRANRGEGEYESYLPRLHREAQAFLYEHSLMIVCPHCIQDKARTKILEGTIIFHFKEDVAWSWTSHCPKCKQLFSINQDNWQDFTRANIEKLGRGNVSEEETIE